jgi:hypothetical protein
VPARGLRVALERTGRLVVLRLGYPAAQPERDLSARPRWARRGRVVARLAGRRIEVAIRRGRAVVTAEPGGSVSVARGAARDRFGNRSGNSATG